MPGRHYLLYPPTKLYKHCFCMSCHYCCVVSRVRSGNRKVGSRNQASVSLIVRAVLMRSETWIEKAGFRSKTKNGFHMQLKKGLFSPRLFFFIIFSNWTRRSRKLKFSIRHASRIHAIGKNRKSRRLRVSHTHATTTRHTTRPHITTSATLAWLLSLLQLLAASQRDTSFFTPGSKHVSAPDGRSARYR